MRKSATTTVASLSLMLIMGVFEVVDEKRENGAQRSKKSVKDEARGI